MPFDPLQLAYFVPFAAATAACLVALVPARRISHAATRRGMAGLLVLSAAWAGAEGGRILVADRAIGTVVYVVGLVVGFSTVFAWLYFVSAYTGSDYHRISRYRRAGLAVYLAVLSVKLTNPIHGLYFAVERTSQPFPHLAVSYGALNWVVLAAAYGLSGLGFIMLYRFFTESPWNTRTLGLLVAVTALPVAGTVAGRLTGPETVLGVNYEPLGVAVFAVGALFLVLDSFRATLGEYGGAMDQITDAVIVVDEAGRIRRSNETARTAFPPLVDGVGARLADRLPAVDAALGESPGHAVVDDRRWLCRVTPLSLGPHEVGQAVVLTDVTALRRQRAELSRQNRQLEAFAEAITHELRNGVAIADGHLGRAERALTLDGEADQTDRITVSRARLRDAIDGIDAARTGVARTERIVDDLATLTRLGQTVRAREYESCSMETLAEAGVDDVAIVVTRQATIQADPVRLERLFDRASTFAAANGADRLIVTPTADGFTIADDGRPLQESDPASLFEYGDAVPNAETGMLLPMVGSLARVHGWRVEPDPDYRQGIRYEIREAAVELGAPTPAGAALDREATNI